MQVKVGERVYDSSDEPVMVVLEPHEKAEIAALAAHETMYCCYPAEMAESAVRAWMHGAAGGNGARP